MDIVERLMLRTGETDQVLLQDCIETARHVFLSRRYPFGNWPVQEITIDNGDGTYTTTEDFYIEPRYMDWVFRAAMDLYNKQGSEGEMSHSENGISRAYEGSWISKQLLQEIVPYAGTFGTAGDLL